MKNNNNNDDEKIVAALLGVLVFCVGRVYRKNESESLIRIQYLFEFDNGYGASVVEFKDKNLSSNKDFEIAVIKMDDSFAGFSIVYNSDVMYDIDRGDAELVEKRLIEIEKLK